MKRGEIVVLAALLVPIALGTIVYELRNVIAFLIMFAMEPAGTGCDEGPFSDMSATNARGDVVAEYVRACTGIGTVVDYWIAPQLHGDKKLPNWWSIAILGTAILNFAGSTTTR